MKRAWIVNHYATDPAQSASGSRHFSLARNLIKLGWEPTIIAATTEHPAGTQRSGTGGRLTVRFVDGVRFVFLPTPAYGGNGILRVRNIFSFTARLLGSALEAHAPAPDVVIGSTVHPLAAWAASVIARRNRVPFIFEIRDLWPETLIDMGKISRNGLVARLMRRMERALCNRASLVLTLLPFADEYLVGQGVAREKVVWLSNGCDLEHFAALPIRSKPKPFTFMYFGSIGRANGVDEIVRAFAPLADRARLAIYGTGALEERVRTEVLALDIEHAVEFRGVIPKSQVPEAMGSGDALLINVLDLPVYRHGISMNKLFDYMASGRPIVIASNARNNPVVDADAGIAVPAGDIDGFSTAMQAVLEASDDERARWGNNGRRHLEASYDYAVLAQELADVLRDATTRESRLLEP